ncbi:MAG: CPBP family intramembrane metalloprotease [Gemmatimonadales bacterium]
MSLEFENAIESEHGRLMPLGDKTAVALKIVGFCTVYIGALAVANLGWGLGPYLKYGLAAAVCVALTVAILRAGRGILHRGRGSIAEETGWGLAGAVVAVLAVLLVGVGGLEWRQPAAGATGPFALLALFVVVASVTEELLVRGYALFALLQFMRPLTAVLVTAVGFGIAHLRYGLGGVVGSTVIGAVWGGLAVWRRGVLAPVAAHLIWNASFLALAGN